MTTTVKVALAITVLSAGLATSTPMAPDARGPGGLSGEQVSASSVAVPMDMRDMFCKLAGWLCPK